MPILFNISLLVLLNYCLLLHLYTTWTLDCKTSSSETLSMIRMIITHQNVPIMSHSKPNKRAKSKQHNISSIYHQRWNMWYENWITSTLCFHRINHHSVISNHHAPQLKTPSFHFQKKIYLAVENNAFTIISIS